jgi:hypothetical protein
VEEARRGGGGAPDLVERSAPPPDWEREGAPWPPSRWREGVPVVGGPLGGGAAPRVGGTPGWRSRAGGGRCAAARPRARGLDVGMGREMMERSENSLPAASCNRRDEKQGRTGNRGGAVEGNEPLEISLTFSHGPQRVNLE